MRVEFVEGGAAFLLAAREDHLAEFEEGRLGPFAVEHVLGAHQADAFGPECPGLAGVLRRVGVGPHSQAADLVACFQERHQTRVLRVRARRRHLAGIDDALRAVQGNPVAFAQGSIVNREGLGGGIDLQGAGADDTALAPSSGDECGMARHPAAGGQNRRRGAHPFDVLGVGFLATEDGPLAAFGPLDSGRGREHQSPRRSAWAGRQTFRQDVGFPLGFRVEDRMQEFVELRGRDARDGGGGTDEAAAHHLHRHAKGGRTVPLSGPRLEHPEAVLLDRELDVLHVAVVPFQFVSDADKLLIDLRHGPFEALVTGGLVGARRLVQRVGRPDAGDHVLALGIGKPFAVELIFAGGGVPREGDARGGIVAHVAEDHGLDVGGGAPRVGDGLDAAVGEGALAVPRLEHGADGAPELLLRVVGERLAEDLFHLGPVDAGKFFQLVGRQVGVVLRPDAFFHLRHFVFELMADALALSRFDVRRLLHHHVGVHGDEAAVGVPYEPRVVRQPDYPGDRARRQADVQHRLHHTGHRGAGARAARNEQGIVRVAEPGAHDLLDAGEGLVRLALQFLGVPPAMLVIVGADLGRDGEPGRDGHAEIGHFGQIGPFAAEEFFHVGPAVRLAVAEEIDVLPCLRHRASPFSLLSDRFPPSVRPL